MRALSFFVGVVNCRLLGKFYGKEALASRVNLDRAEQWKVLGCGVFFLLEWGGMCQVRLEPILPSLRDRADEARASK